MRRLLKFYSGFLVKHMVTKEDFKATLRKSQICAELWSIAKLTCSQKSSLVFLRIFQIQK